MSWGEYSLQIFKENKKLYSLYLITVVATYSLESIGIPKYTSELTTTLNKEDNLDEVKTIFIKLISLWTCNQILYTLDHFIRAQLIPTFEQAVLDKVFFNLIKKYENDYQELDYTMIITKMNSFPKIMRNITNVFFKHVMPRTLILLIICGYFLRLNRKIGLLVSTLVLMQLNYLKNTGSVCKSFTNNSQDSYDRLISLFTDKFQNLASIYGSGMINEEIANVNEVNAKSTQAKILSYMCTAKTQSKGYFFNIIIFSLVNYTNFQLYQKKEIDVKTFISIFLISINLLSYLVDLSHTLPEFYYDLEVMKRFQDFFSFPDQNKSLKPPISITNGKITLSNVSFMYPKSEKAIIKNLSFEFKPDKITGIIGSSGAGKSTLLKLMLGFLPLTNGEILVDGQNINDYDLNSYRKNIGYVNQNVRLFNKTIIENILYGFTLERQKVKAVVDKYSINKIFKNLSNGLDTECGVGGDNLSGGQKQIVMLLRVFLNPNKKILILDEPTAAIDADSKKVIYKMIQDLSTGKTVIAITHDPQMISIFTSTLKL